MTAAGAGSAGRSTRMRTKARTRLILERRGRVGKVTKVLGRGRGKEVPLALRAWPLRLFRGRAKSFNHREHRGTQGRFVVCSLRLFMKPAVVRLWRMIGLAWLLLAATAWAQAGGSSLHCPQTQTALYSRFSPFVLLPPPPSTVLLP